MKTFWCWTILLLGCGVSIVANVEHTHSPLVIAKCMAAVMPVFQALAIHLSQQMRQGWTKWIAWGVAGLCFLVSYEATYAVLESWGWSWTSARLAPAAPELAAVLAVLGLAEVTERRMVERHEASENRRREEENRQAMARIRPSASTVVAEPSTTVKRPAETISPTVNDTDIRRQAVDNRRAEKDAMDVRMMADRWPGISFLDIPEADRVRTVRSTLTTEESTCGPDRAKRLVRIYLAHLEESLSPVEES